MRRTAVSFWQKYVHSVLVSHLERLSQPRNSVVGLTEHRYMTEIFSYGVKPQNKQSSASYNHSYFHFIFISF